MRQILDELEPEEEEEEESSETQSGAHDEEEALRMQQQLLSCPGIEVQSAVSARAVCVDPPLLVWMCIQCTTMRPKYCSM